MQELRFILSEVNFSFRDSEGACTRLDRQCADRWLCFHRRGIKRGLPSRGCRWKQGSWHHPLRPRGQPNGGSGLEGWYHKVRHPTREALHCWSINNGWKLQLINLCASLIFVVRSIMLYSSEISPTRCNNCVFILRNGFTLHVSGDNLTDHQEYICCIWPQVSRLT